jgi:hypothetical protein
MGQGVKDAYRLSGDRTREGDDLLDCASYIRTQMARVGGVA